MQNHLYTIVVKIDGMFCASSAIHAGDGKRANATFQSYLFTTGEAREYFSLMYAIVRVCNGATKCALSE